MATIKTGRIISFDLILKDRTDTSTRQLKEMGFEIDEQNDDPSFQIWRPNGLQTALEKLVAVGGTLGNYDVNLLSKFVERLEVRIFKNTVIPLPLVLAEFSLKNEALTVPISNKEIWSLSAATITLIEKIGGLSKELFNWGRLTPFLIDLGVKLEPEELAKIVEKADRLRKISSEETTATQQELIQLSKEIREIEPISFRDTNLDIDAHSIICGLTNLLYVAGHVGQPASGGLRTPYLLTLSCDENLLLHPQRPPFPDEIHDYADLLMIRGNAFLLPISFLIWCDYLDAQSRVIEESLRKLRAAMNAESSDFEAKLSEMSIVGVSVASLAGELDTAKRASAESLKFLISRSGLFASEVQVLPKYEFPTIKGESPGPYFETLAKRWRARLTNSFATFRSLERQVSLLQRHTSDIVTFRNTKASLKLTYRISLLTAALVVLTGAILLLAIFKL